MEFLKTLKYFFNMKEIILVYNETLNPISLVENIITRYTDPSKYSCNLCHITSGHIKMKNIWKEYLASVECKTEVYLKKSFSKKYPKFKNYLYPAIFTLDDNDNVKLLISESEIKDCSEIEMLIALMKNKLADFHSREASKK